MRQCFLPAPQKQIKSQSEREKQLKKMKSFIPSGDIDRQP